jgi:hypothetical protein
MFIFDEEWTVDDEEVTRHSRNEQHPLNYLIERRKRRVVFISALAHRTAIDIFEGKNDGCTR